MAKISMQKPAHHCHRPETVDIDPLNSQANSSSSSSSSSVAQPGLHQDGATSPLTISPAAFRVSADKWEHFSALCDRQTRILKSRCGQGRTERRGGHNEVRMKRQERLDWKTAGRLQVRRPRDINASEDVRMTFHSSFLPESLIRSILTFTNLHLCVVEVLLTSDQIRCLSFNL